MYSSMALRNRIKPLVEKLGVTPYRFAKDVGVAHNTVYKLYNKPEELPAIGVVEKICKAYPGTQPNDVVYYEPDDDIAA